MRTDAGRGTVDEGRRRRGTLEALTPAAKPVQKLSPESADRGSWISSILRGPKAKIEEARQDRSMLPARLARLGDYGLALVLVAAAALLRWALWDVLSPTPFLVFYLAWVAAAAFGGLGPGLLATLVSWWCIDFLFDPAPSHIGFHDMASMARLSIFLAGGLAVSAVGEKMRRTRIRERRQGRKLAGLNAALRASEEKYRRIVETATEAIVMADARARIVFVNDRWAEITGYTREEAGQMTLFDVVFPEDLAVATTRWESRQQGRRESYEFRLRRKDGSAVWALLGVAPTLGPTGEFLGELIMATDITQRKRAEEALRASEGHYRFLVENSKDITWTTDLQGTWTFISSNVEEVTGYRADEVVGKTIWDFLAPECHDLVKENLRRRVHGEDVLPYEVLVVGKDGRPTPFEVVTSSIVDAGGNVVGVQGVSRDVTERKRAEEALRASEEKYRFLVENSKDITWTMDLQGKWTFISSNVEKVAGYRVDEIMGKTLWDFLAPECHEFVKEKLRRRARGEDLPPYEVLIVGKDGRRMPFELLAASIVDKDGNVVGVQGVSRDITERKRAEQDLSESRNRYQALIETTADFIWEMDASGRYTYCSPQMKDLWGYEPKDMIGKTPFELMPPEDREEAIKGFLSVAKSAQPFTGREASSYDNQGRLITVEISGVPFFDADGRLLGYRGISRDVTERKRAQEALAESRKKYRGLVEKINDWVWEIDADGVYTYSSPRALDLLGYAPEEIVGRTPFDLMPPAEARRVWNAFQPIWLERKPLERLENTLVRKDGRLVTVETSGMPVFAEDGSFLGYTGVDRDVTERKWAEEQLRRSEQDLNRAQAVAQTGSWRLDVRRNELLWSDETYRIFRIPRGTPMTYETFLAAVHPEDREYVDRRWTAALRGEPYDIEHRILAEGRLKWVREKAELEFDEEGMLLGGFGTVQDITERKRAEEALRASEGKYRFLVENSKDITWMIDLQGRWTFVSSNVEKLVGYRVDEVLGRFIWDFLAPECHDLVQEELGRRRRGEDVSPYEVLVVGKDGRRTPFELHTSPIVDDGGSIVGVQGVSRDITERKKAEEMLRELNATLESKVAQRTEELEQRARQLQRLTLELTEAEERERKRLAEILHDDLQQVLAAAKFQVGLLDNRVRNDPESQEIAGQARDLLVDAIAKSRNLSHELSAPALSRSDLCEAFEWLAEQMQKKHGFTVHLDVGTRLEVASEPLRVLLYQAAQESLFNVIKHAGVHEAKLRLRRRRGQLRLLVSDQGRGFDPADPGCTLGFGLLSIRERVGHLGGRLKIRSTAGKGSTFFLTVPDAESER